MVTHGHTHAHRHEHQHAPADAHGHELAGVAPAAPCASVAIEVGGGRGALILYPSERFRGTEIEVSSATESGRERVHTGVHERTTQTRSMLTAIFGSLPAGDYVVWEDAVTAGPIVEVRDGLVSELTLS
jgi:hypothetical protein